MTLQQLKYVVVTEECGSISDAAERLFIAQPSLSKSIRLLEEELGFALFARERKGVKATSQGMEFLCYAKRVLEQSDRLEERFGKEQGKGAYYTRRIHISAQPVYRATEAFSAVLKEYGGSEYTFTLTCDSLLQVIENVLSRKSELGVICVYDDDRKMMEKIFRDNELEFISAYQTDPVAWMWVDHPLAKKEYVTPDEIGQWPVVSYEAISPGTASLSGNIDFGRTFSKNIHLTSDSDIACILKNIKGIYISGKDFLKEEKEIVTVPISGAGKIEVGIIKFKNTYRSSLGSLFIEEMKQAGGSVETVLKADDVEIHTAKMEELPYIMEIYEYAKKFMADTGNPHQWGDTYPAADDIVKDIEQGELHVCTVNGKIQAVFAATKGKTLGYDHLVDGAWIKDEGEYLAIHRLASWGTQRGMADRCIAWCEEKCHDLRADTHEDNKIIQHIFEKNGFKRCGKVIIFDGSERIAYQKIIE